VNNPDKVVFVGEALVGNEAVDQLSKFDRALRDFTGARKRGIDGILLTKFDTIVSAAARIGLTAGRQSRCGVVDDLCYRTANIVRRVRADIHRPETVTSGAYCAGIAGVTGWAPYDLALAKCMRRIRSSTTQPKRRPRVVT
jgi:hypothetical protein